MARTTYSPQFKAKLVLEVLSGEKELKTIGRPTPERTWKTPSTLRSKRAILRENPAVWSVQGTTKVILAYLGNICRSTIIEFVTEDLAIKTGLESQSHIESDATRTEETCDPAYPPAIFLTPGLLVSLMPHGGMCRR